MREYLFATIESDGFYDVENCFEDCKKAIEYSLMGYDVVVLDALSLELLGSI